MRFVANRRLDITPQGQQEPLHYEPGDVLPEFDTWAPHIQRNMLDVGMVRLDTTAVLEDGTCATCGQPVAGKTKKGRAA